MVFKHIKIYEEIIESNVNISAHNHFKLIINGKIVSGLVSPAPSVVTKEKLYLSYDLKKYLKVGMNKIEVVVLYLGGSGQNYLNGEPGFILEGIIKTVSSKIDIISDESFLVYEETPFKDDMPFQQSRRITPVQYYDDRVKLNDKNSFPAVQLNGYQNYHKQEILEGVIHKNIKPILLYEQKDVKVYDCGEIISGFVTIKLISIADETITVRYSEDLEQESKT